MNTQRIKQLFFTIILVVSATTYGCSDESKPHQDEPQQSNSTSGNTTGNPEQPDPYEGFTSADVSTNNGNVGASNGTTSTSNGTTSGSDRSVEEGDIYRVLGQGLLLNLNAYRGLQLIDISDPSYPEIVGRIQVSGKPVELYVVGDRAYILLNNWHGYYALDGSINVNSYYGGMVAVADISNPAQPRIIDQAQVPGSIQTSRLTRDNGQESLFVVSNNRDDNAHTIVRSFAISDQGELNERTTLDLGGYVMDIQATPQHLMVARNNWEDEHNRTLISLVDISDPDGHMVEGGVVQANGVVFNKTNMNIHNNMLRIASSGRWRSSNTNHLQTWDISDIHRPIPIDHATYGDGEQLFATLFLENKAFVVTYRRVDPFHAFEITDDGFITEKIEYIISGWNSFFRPVFGDTRLIGIGVDDQNGQEMAVSLYKTDLEVEDPFVNRQTASAAGARSEALWDDRAFSVLENAVSVMTDDGVEETGLVLLPFSGYDDDTNTYHASVQIFTFSADTLTARGVMEHYTPVRRSFLADGTTTANLSDRTLSLFDHTAPDAPAEHGRIDLAPSYTNFFIVGETDSYGVRIHNTYANYYTNYSTDAIPLNRLEVVALDKDPDIAKPLAVVEFPPGSWVYQIGNMLLIARSSYEEMTQQSHLQVVDFSNPLEPQMRGEMTTDALTYITSSYGYGCGCYDGYYGGYYGYNGYGTGRQAFSVGQALVFPETKRNSEITATVTHCHYVPSSSNWSCNNNNTSCSFYDGYIDCYTRDGVEVCENNLMYCVRNSNNATEEFVCEQHEEQDTTGIEFYERCTEDQEHRYWTSQLFKVIDVSDPDNPTLTSLNVGDGEAAGTTTHGSALYYSYKVPVEVPVGSQPQARYFYKRIDFTNPSQPQIDAPINVPGHIVGFGDTDTLFTQDYHWGDYGAESSVNKLSIRDGRAYLEATHRWTDRIVDTLISDERGNILALHRAPHELVQNLSYPENRAQTLTLLDFNTPNPQPSDLPLGPNNVVQDMVDGRVIFKVSGGILMVNITDVAAPFAQAYFPIRGWTSSGVTIENQTAYMPAGVYGMYKFDIDTFNLLTNAL